MMSPDNNYLKFIQENKNLIDCCSSSNIDESVKKNVSALNRNILFNSLVSYPELNYQNLIEAIKNKFNIDQVLFGNGSDDLICRINTFININKTNKTLVLTPTFYRIYETLDKYELKNTSKINDIDFNGYDYVWLVNPNSVNNQILKKEKIHNLIQNNPNTTFIIDEVSILFLKNYSKISLFSSTKIYKNLLVLSSFSKFYGLPGLRLGFVSGNNKLMDFIKKTNPVFPVNNITKKIILNLLKDTIIDKTIRKNIEIGKNQIKTILKKINGLKIKESKLNFIFINHPIRNIYNELLKSGIIAYNLNLSDNWVRITIHGSSSLNEILLIKLNNLCQKYDPRIKN